MTDIRMIVTDLDRTLLHQVSALYFFSMVAQLKIGFFGPSPIS